jgi:hypothetical protein
MTFVAQGLEMLSKGTTMKKTVIIALLIMPLGLAAQDIQHEAKTINIEIPVRVFRGDVFVADLTKEDFEVYEDGRLQTLDAVYLIKKTSIERREEARPFTPETSRHFYLFFEIAEYDPKLGQAIDYFVRNVLIPGDDLTVVTPMKSYRMKSETFRMVGRDKVFDQLLGLLRRDTQIGNSEYRGVVNDMMGLVKAMSAGIAITGTDGIVQASAGVDSLSGVSAQFQGESFEELLQTYAYLLDKLQSLRAVDQRRMLDFATFLRDQPGQKGIFLFYQREFIPKIDPRVLNLYLSQYNDRPDILQTIQGLFEFYRRESNLDVDTIKKVYSDASTAIHFLFLATPGATVPGVRMEEASEDIYAPFMEMARATGGYAASSANVTALMKGAVEAAENYYLLYYTPRDYKADGQFHTLQVRTKKSGLRTSHRSGYIAD